jgi:hypothetical protein
VAHQTTTKYDQEEARMDADIEEERGEREREKAIEEDEEMAE